MMLFRKAGSGAQNGSIASAPLAKPISQKEMDAAMNGVANKVSQWDATRIVLVKPLMDAARNHGQVLLMKDTSHDNRLMAVKRMPTRWVRASPKDFEEKYASASEKPWNDIGLVHHLSTVGFPYVCELYGVFRSPEDTFVATTFCTGGDLFGWCDLDSTPAPGLEREAAIKPIATQILSGVRWLHDLGIAHRDLSLENILLIQQGGETKVKIIDFGMATLRRTVRSEVRGKHSYQSPEMHGSAEIDTFLADDFAIGVTLFAMAAQDYPWTCTRKGKCQLFEYVTAFGLRRFCDKRRLRKGQGEFLGEVFSPAFLDTVESLLQLNCKSRGCLGEAAYHEEVKKGRRKSVWDLGYFSAADMAVPTKSGASCAGALAN